MLVGNTDNHKHNCEFSEESIAYLYGEMDEPQKKIFSLHLENCPICADELKAFSGIHSSIQNWKIAKFDTVPTPIIQIQPDLLQKSANKISFSNSWLDNLRERFSVGRILVPIGAFALLLICMGFAVFFLNFETKNEIAADSDANKRFREISSNVETAVKTEKSEMENAPEPEISAPVSSNDSAIELKSETKNSPVKISTPVKVSTKSENIKNNRKTINNSRQQRAFKSEKNAQPANRRSLPKLNNLPEDAEVEELRLTDLFAEISDR